MSEIGHCADCRTFTEQDVCTICANPRRQQNGQICVVESPADIHAIEQTGQFAGRYFVLMGHLSPLDGIGPGDIGLDRLEQRLEKESITEVILATNPTVEGEARQLHRRDVRPVWRARQPYRPWRAGGRRAGNGRRHHAVAFAGRASRHQVLMFSRTGPFGPVFLPKSPAVRLKNKTLTLI